MTKFRSRLRRHVNLILGLLLLLLVLLIWGIGAWLGWRSLSALLTGIVTGAVLAVAYLVYLKVKGTDASSTLERLFTDQADQAILDARPEDRQELSLLRDRLLRALDILKKSRLGSGSGKDALYRLPWYMLVGQPAAGKTTLLHHSGLVFPLAEKNGMAVPGIGGTRNCDWFFSTDAVLLDTAGRYVGTAGDASQWQGFLGLLRQYRPKGPLNGLIVVASMLDVMGADENASLERARQLRERLQEVHDKLAQRLPIYVIFTKCDLVEGFSDFFAQAQADPAKPWGASLPHAASSTMDVATRFDRYFDELADSLDVTARRACAQRDHRQADASLHTFPAEFRDLKPRLRTFITALFEGNFYQSQPLLRGFYFVSALQNGDADVAPHKAAVGTQFGLPALSQAATRGQSRSYFLPGLFRDVIIPDRYLASHYSKRRMPRRQACGFAAATVAGVLLCGLWGTSYVNNRRMISRVDTDLSAAVKATSAMNSKDGDAMTLRQADALRPWVARLYQEKHEGVPFTHAVGLYQGDAVARAIRPGYFGALNGVMLQPIARNLEATLTQLPTLPVYQRDSQALTPVDGIVSVAKPLWPADNSAAKIAAFGSDTLKTYTMMASAKGIDTAYLNQRMPLYWAPTLEKRLPAGTDGREWQALAQRQIALYVAQMPEPDVPKIRDNNFLVVSSRNYIDGLLTQSLAPIATITLESDTLFDFGRSDFQSLRKEGQKALNDVAARLLNMDAGKIIITGYADRLGDADANRLVSQKRAETIRTYLIGKGLPADIVEAKGAGADRPLVKCEDTLPRAQLIRCLAPNRRVEIEVRGAKG